MEKGWVTRIHRINIVLRNIPETLSFSRLGLPVFATCSSSRSCCLLILKSDTYTDVSCTHINAVNYHFLSSKHIARRLTKLSQN